MSFYWTRHPGGPFVTLTGVAATYLHPEADHPGELRSRARLADEDDEEMRTFKAGLREAILHPGRLPDGDLIGNVPPGCHDPEVFPERLCDTSTATSRSPPRTRLRHPGSRPSRLTAAPGRPHRGKGTPS